ncbi:MAG: MYXO-CTERM sorting domain-containing protein [Myxococcales bacterium]|nr:MYXO-CTERM sorting domain-containing protein [Myxococcales bacterium]
MAAVDASGDKAPDHDASGGCGHCATGSSEPRLGALGLVSAGLAWVIRRRNQQR